MNVVLCADSVGESLLGFLIQRQSSANGQSYEGAASCQRDFIGKCRHSLVSKTSSPGRCLVLLSHNGKRFSTATFELKGNHTKGPLSSRNARKQNIYFNLIDLVLIDLICSG